MVGIDEVIRRLQQSIGVQKTPMEQDAPAKEIRCLKCGDTGIVYSGDVAWACSCRQNAKELKQQEMMAPELQGCNLEEFRLGYYDGRHLERARVALDGARQFTDGYLLGKPSRGIMFTGDVGAGKTYLAAAIANQLLGQGIPVRFVVVPDFLDELRAALINNNGDSRETDDVSLLKSISKVDVLALDDLGVHNYTQWTCNKLYSLLNYRLNYHLPVVITTNLKMSELDEYLGERTTSRIVQMCSIHRLTVSKDIRHIINKTKLRQEE